MNTYYFYYLILFTLLISYIIQRLIGYYKKINAKNERDDLSEIAKTGGLIEFIRQKHAKYGDIVEFYMGKNNHVVSIIEPNLIKATMKLGSRPKYLFHFLAPLLGEDNLQIFSAERASQFRKLVSNCLDSQIINQKYDIIMNIANEIINDKWQKYENDKKTICLQDELLEFGLIAMIYSLMSTDIPDIDLKVFKDSYDKALGGLFDKQMGRQSYTESEINEAIKYMKENFENLIKQRNQLLEVEGTSNEKSDLCDVLLRSNDPNTGKPFTNEMIVSHLSGYLLAGYHTTAIATTWTLFALTQYPQIYKKLQQEIDENITGLPTIKDLEKLKYLDKVVKESLRVYTPGPFAARLVDKDQELPNGFVLKKGTTLFYPLFLINRNEKYWLNADKFDPERFNELNNIYTNSYCPFGYGLRICPGERLSRIEIRMLIVLIMQKYDFKLDMNIEDVVPVERFVVMAKNDVKIKLFNRY